MFTKEMGLEEKILITLDSILGIQEDEDGSIYVVFEPEEVKELYELYSELIAEYEDNDSDDWPLSYKAEMLTV